jgi:hypothetical protein
MTKSGITINGRAGSAWLAMIVFFVATALAVAEPLRLNVVEATPAYSTRDSTPLVSFRLSEDSKRAFADFSSLNVGKKIDIRFEGKTITQTVIREPITGGVGQIIVANPDEARQLANRLIDKTPLEVEVSP